MEIRSTNLGGNSQVSHKSNESMLQSKPGGAGAMSKGNKSKGQEKVTVAVSSEELLVDLKPTRAAKVTEARGGVWK